MYYLRCKLGEPFWYGFLTSDVHKDANARKFTLAYSNNILMVLDNENNINGILGECVINEPYAYIPLTKMGNGYYQYASNSTQMTFSNIYPSWIKGTIVDDSFSVVFDTYYMYTYAGNNGCAISVCPNPNDIKSTRYTSSASTITNPIETISTSDTHIKLSEILNKILNASASAGVVGGQNLTYGTNNKVEQYTAFSKYSFVTTATNTSGSTKSVKCTYYCSYLLNSANSQNIYILYDVTSSVATRQGNIAFMPCSVLGGLKLNKGECIINTHSFSVDYGSRLLPDIYTTDTLSFFFENDTDYNVYYTYDKSNDIYWLYIDNPIINQYNMFRINFAEMTYQYLGNSKTSNQDYIYYQEPYTPINKLQTPTFSDLEVQHNESTGTYALTFKANNPNSVSVSCDIVISGREVSDNISLPSGDSEWSFALAENKSGTLQGTNISALGYENADDTSIYKYSEWVAPGYLREPQIYQCYLSTIDDKHYTLNVTIINNNSVKINAILHYGKSLENKQSVTIQLASSTFNIENVENTNGSVYFSYEQVEGYYPLPDSEVSTYTKLPLPPVPSSTGITLFKNNNNNKVVNKGYKLETYKVLNGTFRDSVNILNPVFQIENDEVPDCNYCYIADFRRYYYIDTITCVSTGLYEIQCSVDVLYTYKDNILTSEQYVSRQENEYNELLFDEMVTFDNDYEYTIYSQNIDELDYGIDEDKSTSKPSEKVNLILSWYQTKG